MSTEREGGTGIMDRSQEELKEPPLHSVIFHNDDFTPMDLVVEILVEVFHHDEGQAGRIMMDVHTKGRGIAGTYTAEVAETKCAISIAIARGQEYPLEVTHEPA